MSEIKYKSEVYGKGGIYAKVVAHSKSAYSGQEIVTFEYEMPKCILAELNTHRQFSRNAQSSRAVPINKVIDQIRTNPVTPIYWGANQAGMVAGEEIDSKVDFIDYTPLNKFDAWAVSAKEVADLMEAWDRAGYHKQIVNRIGEAFTFVRGVITATEFDNFFHLRIHPAADPFIQELARCMWEALQASEAEILYEGEWHTPYVEHFKHDISGKMAYINPTQTQEVVAKHGTLWVSLERAKQISAAACAQVSFRKLDLSDETVDRVYSRLVDEETPHASCVEHQASPVKVYNCYEQRKLWINKETKDTTQDDYDWPLGITHMDRSGDYWSGNFRHFVQNRKLIPNEACRNYTPKIG